MLAAFGVGEDHGVVGLGDALPAAVAVHGVVAAADGGDLAAVVFAHLLLQLFEISGAVGGQGVAAVHEGVDEDAIDAVLLRHFQQRVQMRLLRVHAAVGEQAEQMQPALAGARVLHGIEQHGMREKFAVLDHQVDAGDVHVHDAAGADVEVADFAVAHLPFGQADERPAGMNQRVGILAQQAVIGGLAGERDGVGFGFGAVSPAVEDDENEWFRTQDQLLAFISFKITEFGSASGSLPDRLDGIIRESRVGCDQWQLLFQALRNQDAVEWVAVMHRDTFQPPDVGEAQWQNRNAIHLQLSGEIISNRSGQNELADLHLHDDFPKTHDADPHVRPSEAGYAPGWKPCRGPESPTATREYRSGSSLPEEIFDFLGQRIIEVIGHDELALG